MVDRPARQRPGLFATSTITLILLPVAINLATNALPHSWRQGLWLAWPLAIVLAVAYFVLERRGQHDPSPDPPLHIEHPIDPSAKIWNVPRKTSDFADRVSELREISSTLSGDVDRVVIVSGLVGSGKTQLALAHAADSRGSLDIGWWTLARDRYAVIASLAELGLSLGVAAQDKELAARRVVQLLATKKSWLWILDDAGDVYAIRDLIPSTEYGQVLITTRLAPNTGAGHLLVTRPFAKEDASEYLRLRSGDDDHESANRLAERLGGLPIALELAGAYCGGSHITLSKYLERYETGRSKLMTGRDFVSTNFSTALRISLDEVTRSNPRAMQLLTLFAFMGTAPIPRDILEDTQGSALSWTTVDPLAYDGAILVLTRRSLLTVTLDGGLLLNEFVAETVRDRVQETEKHPWRRRFSGRSFTFKTWQEKSFIRWPTAQWTRILVQLVGRRLPREDSRRPEGWVGIAGLLPHCQVILERLATIDGRVRRDDKAAGIQLSRDLGMRLYRSGNYDAGEALAFQALELSRQSLGALDPITLECEVSMAHILHAKGQYQEASRRYEEVLEIRKRTLGDEHLDTIATMNDLGGVLMEMPEGLERAKHFYEQVVAIRKRRLGERDLFTLISMNNLGKTYRRLGDLEHAQEIALRVIEIGSQDFGEEHPDVLVWVNNLGEAYRQSGDLQRADDTHRKNLAIRTRVLGDDHPLTLVSMNNSARIAQLRGDLSRAGDLYETSLERATRNLGRSHPYSKAAQQGLSAVRLQAAPNVATDDGGRIIDPQLTNDPHPPLSE